jgi:uncharacterized protein
MNWVDMWALFALGLMGSGHCVGMCGGFALAAGRGYAGAPRSSLLVRIGAYHTGKALTYISLALLLTAGFGFAAGSGWFSEAQSWLSFGSGVAMAAIGLAMALEWRSSWFSRLLEPVPACRSLGALAADRTLLSSFFLGWVNGFLPCGLLLAALFYAANLGSLPAAAFGTAAFAAGTVPALAGFAYAGWRLAPQRRRTLLRLAGISLILFGAVNVARAWPEGRHWIHENLTVPVGRAVVEWCR